MQKFRCGEASVASAIETAGYQPDTVPVPTVAGKQASRLRLKLSTTMNIYGHVFRCGEASVASAIETPVRRWYASPTPRVAGKQASRLRLKQGVDVILFRHGFSLR